jgi:hypothetical protein
MLLTTYFSQGSGIECMKLLTHCLLNASIIWCSSTIVAIIKLHALRSQQNDITLQHEQQSPGEQRQLRTHNVVKLAVLYCKL